MMEALDLLGGIWSSLSRDQKLGVILLSTSLPLGLLSVGVGVVSGSALLLCVGLATLMIGTYTVIHVGFAVLKLIVFLMKSVLRLPFVLLRMMKSELRENVSDLSTLRPGVPGGWTGAGRSRRDGRGESLTSSSFSWFDFVFLVWVVLALIQIYILHGFFFAA